MSFDLVLQKEQEVNNFARSLIDRPAFDAIQVTLPVSSSPEIAFIRATSWLYCLYFEAGRVSLRFLKDRGVGYAVMDRTQSDHHQEAVRCLRTELHHNLGYQDSDQVARKTAEHWRREACGSAFPATGAQWQNCHERLVEDASELLTSILWVLRRIEAEGEGAREYLDEWIRRLERSWTAAEFDPVIEDAKYRLGLPALDTVRFRNRHVDRWRKALDLLEDGFDFVHETTRLIEKTLVDESSHVLPITGNDIIMHLKVEPGPEIARLLREARLIHEERHLDRDAILEHLRQSQG